MKIKTLITTLLISCNLLAQWNVPKTKYYFKQWGNIFHSESTNGALMLNYCPTNTINPISYGMRICEYWNGEFDSLKFNYEYLEQCYIELTSFDNKKTKIILFENQYENNVFGSYGYCESSESTGNFMSLFANYKGNCESFYMFNFTIEFLSTLDFKKIQNSKKVKFIFFDENKNSIKTEISMQGYNDLLKILKQNCLFLNNHWYWNDDKCLTKWQTSIHNKSGIQINKNQTICFELVRNDQVVFRKNFSINKDVGVNEIIPIEFKFEIPLCIDDVDELSDKYDWNINLN